MKLYAQNTPACSARDQQLTWLHVWRRCAAATNACQRRIAGPFGALLKRRLVRTVKPRIYTRRHVRHTKMPCSLMRRRSDVTKSNTNPMKRQSPLRNEPTKRSDANE